MAESSSHFVMHDRQGRQISLLNDHAQDHHHHGHQHARRCEARSMSDSLLDYISASAASRSAGAGAQAESPLMRPGSYPQSESSRQPPPPYRHLMEPRQFAPLDSPSALPTPYDISPQIFSTSRSGGLDEKPFTHYFDMPTERPAVAKAPSYLQQYAATASPYVRPDAGCRLPSAQHLFHQHHRRPSHELPGYHGHQTTASPIEMGMPSPGTASSTPSVASSSPGLVPASSVSSASSLSSSASSSASMTPLPRPEKRYPCKFRLSLGCTSTFTTSGHASRHSNKHTREKMVQCTHPGCSRLFTRADNMQQHLRTHRKDKDSPAGRAATARSARGGSTKAPSSSASRSERAASDESQHDRDHDQHRPLSLLQLTSGGRAPGENPMQTLLRASELVLDKAQEAS